MSKQSANYTPDMEAQIQNALQGTFESKDYEGQQQALQELADAFDKKVPSVRQKAVRMGLYVPKSKVAASNKRKGKTKSDFVQEIANFTQTDVEVMDSLEKSSRPALQKIVEAFSRLTTQNASE